MDASTEPSATASLQMSAPKQESRILTSSSAPAAPSSSSASHPASLPSYSDYAAAAPPPSSSPPASLVSSSLNPYAPEFVPCELPSTSSPRRKSRATKKEIRDKKHKNVISELKFLGYDTRTILKEFLHFKKNRATEDCPCCGARVPGSLPTKRPPSSSSCSSASHSRAASPCRPPPWVDEGPCTSKIVIMNDVCDR